MKKLIKIFLASLFISVTFSSCYNVIFQNILKEVPLNDGSVTGFVNKTVRVGSGDSEYIFTQNGCLYAKKVPSNEEEIQKFHQYGAWTRVSYFPEVTYDYWNAKFNGFHVYNLASDKDYLYVIGYTPAIDETEGVNIPSTIKVYCLPVTSIQACYDSDLDQTNKNLADLSDWEELTQINEKIATYIQACKESTAWDYSSYFLRNISICLFSSDDKDTPENRNAYIRIGGGYGMTTSETVSTNNYWNGSENATANIYKLNGSTGESLKASPTTSDDKTLGTLSVDTVSVVNFGGTDYFFDKLASGKYEDFTGSSGVEQFMYYADGANVYWSTTDTSEFSLDTNIIASGFGYNIISSCCTLDSILFGTMKGGVYKLDVSSNALGSKASFVTNADSVMTSPYIIRMLFCEDPAQLELDATLYSSMDFVYTASTAGTTYKNRGLWSYYPNRADNTDYYHWNRE